MPTRKGLFWGEIHGDLLLGFVGIYWDVLGFVGIYWDVLGLLGWVIIGDTVDYHGYNGFLMGHYIWENDLWMGIQ